MGRPCLSTANCGSVDAGTVNILAANTGALLSVTLNSAYDPALLKLLFYPSSSFIYKPFLCHFVLYTHTQYFSSLLIYFLVVFHYWDLREINRTNDTLFRSNLRYLIFSYE